MSELTISRATYHGGFSHIETATPVHGRLVLDDDALTLRGVQNDRYTREAPPIELCRTKAIARLEVTSEQVAKSKLGAALIFGVLGGVTAKGSEDRATLIVHLKSGVAGYVTFTRQSLPSLLGVLTPWARDVGVTIGAAPADEQAPGLAGEIAKLAELRDAGALSEDEFAAAKARLIGT